MALADLIALGTALGDVAFAPGPGGNVSVKDDEALWIKASGVRLRDVGAPRGHARVARALVERALAGDATADAEMFAASPRPSLETYFHAAPARVVAHTHPIHLC